MTSVTVELDDIYRLAHDVMLAMGVTLIMQVHSLISYAGRSVMDPIPMGYSECLVMSKPCGVVKWMAKPNQRLKIFLQPSFRLKKTVVLRHWHRRWASVTCRCDG